MYLNGGELSVAGTVLTGRLNGAGNDDDRALPSWLRNKELEHPGKVYSDCMVLTRCSSLLLCIFDSSVLKWWRTLGAGIVLTGRLNGAGNDDDRAIPSWLRKKELAWWRSLVSESCWHGVDHIVVVAWRLNGDRMVLAGW